MCVSHLNLLTTNLPFLFGSSSLQSAPRFLSTAKGSFGLCLTCSLDTDRSVLSAWNQPMSIGFAPTRNLVVYGSESSALMVPLPGTAPDGSALDDAELTISHRFDIDNVDGEVIELLFAHDFVFDDGMDASVGGGAAPGAPWGEGVRADTRRERAAGAPATPRAASAASCR